MVSIHQNIITLPRHTISQNYPWLYHICLETLMPLGGVEERKDTVQPLYIESFRNFFRLSQVLFRRLLYSRDEAFYSTGGRKNIELQSRGFLTKLYINGANTKMYLN